MAASAPALAHPQLHASIARPSSSISSRKLKVLIVTENFLPKVDGVTRTLARLLAHLRCEGHECVVLGPESGMASYESHPLVGTFGVPFLPYPGLKLNFLRPKFLRVVRDFDPDVIHVVDPVWLGAQFLAALDAGLAGAKWADRATRPLVASYHTNLPTYALFFGLSWLEPSSWGFLRSLHDRCQLTACPSQSTAELLGAGHGFKNLRLWPRGVDIDAFNPSRRSQAVRDALFSGAPLPPAPPLAPAAAKPAPAIPFLLLTPPPSPGLLPVKVGKTDSRLVILYVGRLSREKNLFFLLSAFAHLLEHTAWPLDTKLVLVGDGPARRALEERTARAGLRAHVHFAGHVGAPAELAALYASADVFAFPSFTETFGQVVSEALAAGLPVAGLDAPGTRDLVRPASGVLLPAPAQGWARALKGEGDPEYDGLVKGYAALLAGLAGAPAARKRMGAAAAAQAMERTWFEAMERMVGCYREAIDLAAAARRQGEVRVQPRAQALGSLVLRASAALSAAALVLYSILRVLFVW